jgi:hypothetical protein
MRGNFGAVKSISASFLSETKALEEVHFPESFNNLTELPEKFLAGSGLKRLDMRGNFGAVKSISASFLADTKALEEVYFPESFKKLTELPQKFLAGSGLSITTNAAGSISSSAPGSAGSRQPAHVQRQSLSIPGSTID